MNKKVRTFSAILLIPIMLLFAGCFSGGGGGGAAPAGGGGGGAAPVGVISGAVGGTTIIAVNAEGDVIATDDTAGRDKDVDTNGDDIPDAYSFALGNIPIRETNSSVRVFIITGGSTLPVFFGTTGTNVINLLSRVALDLGFIDDTLFAGMAVSDNDPTDDPDVTAGPPDAAIPVGINTPPTAGLSLAELRDQGVDALGDGWMPGARTYLEAAVALAGASTSTDADSARFLFALTRFLAPWFDVQSDGASVNINRLGDILDRLGVANDGMRASWDLIEPQDPLPADSPTAGDFQDFLYDVVRPELIGAVENFDDISEDFNKVWTLEFGEEIETDYGDVLYFSGSFQSYPHLYCYAKSL